MTTLRVSLKLREALELEKARVGYVYPDHEGSYYISSNLEGPMECIECTNGYYYREVVD